MAKHKRRRFRLKNIKRLLCCCCPFGTKRYSLNECDDGEDDLRGRFTFTWPVADIDPLYILDKCHCGEDTSTVSQCQPDVRDDAESAPFQATRARKRDVLLEENEVPRAYLPLPRSVRLLQIRASQIWEAPSFQIIQIQRPEHASIHTKEIQRWGETSLQIIQSYERGHWAHRAICTLPANNETTIPRLVFQIRLNALKRLLGYTWSKGDNDVGGNFNLSTTIVHILTDKLHKYLQMLNQKASLTHRRQGDVYSHGKSILVSFLHMLCQGTYYYGRRIQIFRNHCVINYLSMFVPTHPAIFSLIFGSVIYTIRAINMSFQVLKSLQYTDKSGENCDTVNDDVNTDDYHKSNADDDDDEIDERDVIKHYADNNTCANKTGYGGQFSNNADNSARTKKEVIVIYNKLDFQNGLAKTDGIKKSGSSKSRGIPRYCDFELHIQESNNQMPTRSKQNGRVHVKATLSAASDPPPDNLI